MFCLDLNVKSAPPPNYFTNNPEINGNVSVTFHIVHSGVEIVSSVSSFYSPRRHLFRVVQRKVPTRLMYLNVYVAFDIIFAFHAQLTSVGMECTGSCAAPSDSNFCRNVCTTYAGIISALSNF